MRKMSFAAALCLFTAIPVGARAQEAATAPVAAAAPAAAPEAPAVTPRLIGGNTGILVGGVSDQAFALGGIALDGGIILALGAGFSYDGTKAADKTGFTGILHGAYMLKNTANFAAGPELFVVMPFVPKAAETINFQPGFALWYAPFSAPVLFGTSLQLDIKYIQDGGNVVVDLKTPSLRIGYAF